MSDPLSLFPMALAAGGGLIDGVEMPRLVAAGITLLQRSAPLVRSLARRRSALLLPTGPAFFTALSASDGRGAVLINVLASPSEVAWQLADANVGAVFTLAALAERLPREVPRVLLDEAPHAARVIIAGRTQDVDLGSHHGIALEGRSDAPGLDEECAIVYTSAMAGRARGARLSHRNLIANARSTVEAMRLTPTDHALALLPFSHLFGLVVSAAAPVMSGGRVTTTARFHAAAALELIERGDVTTLVGVPAVFAALVQAMDKRGTAMSTHSLRICICGGAPLSTALQERFADLTGVELRQGYGLTEAAPVALANGLSRPNRRGTLGSAMPQVDVTIRDPSSGAQLPVGTTGEICVRGPNVFLGYVNDATDGLCVRDGWLHTGDEGVIDAEGTVTFRGLRKAMFTRNGFNIYPRELERVIGSMPGVQRVRVWPEPSVAHEHDIRAEVIGSVREIDVRHWCEAELSAYKQPTTIVVRAAPP